MLTRNESVNFNLAWYNTLVDYPMFKESDYTQIEPTSYGCNCYIKDQSTGNTLILFFIPWIGDRKHEGHYHLLWKEIIKDKDFSDRPLSLPEVLFQLSSNCTTITKMMRLIRRLIKIQKSYESRSDGYIILKGLGLSYNDIDLLTKLGIVKIRTAFHDNRFNIAKTYYVNPDLKRILKELQNKIGNIHILESIHTEVPLYNKMFNLLNVINCYNYDNNPDQLLKFRLRNSDKYANCLTGRPSNKYSNLPSTENHPELPLISTRQGQLMQKYNASSYYKYDVVSSIPRMIALKNSGTWIDEDKDIYELIYRKLYSKSKFTKELRDELKIKVLRENFSQRPFDLRLKQAMKDVIGSNDMGSEIFVIEGFTYILNIAKLLINNYKVNFVYDCFEFYGNKPEEKWLKNCIKDSALEFYKMYNDSTFDFSYIDTLISSIKSLPDYSDSYDSDKLNTIEYLSGVSFRGNGKIELYRNEEFKENLRAYLEELDIRLARRNHTSGSVYLRYLEICDKIIEKSKLSKTNLLTLKEIVDSGILSRNQWKLFKNTQIFSDYFELIGSGRGLLIKVKDTAYATKSKRVKDEKALRLRSLHSDLLDMEFKSIEMMKVDGQESVAKWFHSKFNTLVKEYIELNNEFEPSRPLKTYEYRGALSNKSISFWDDWIWNINPYNPNLNSRTRKLYNKRMYYVKSEISDFENLGINELKETLEDLMRVAARDSYDYGNLYQPNIGYNPYLIKLAAKLSNLYYKKTNIKFDINEEFKKNRMNDELNTYSPNFGKNMTQYYCIV